MKKKGGKIQFLKRIAKANGYQSEEVDRVIGKMSAEMDKQNTTVLKYSGAVPYVGIRALKKAQINVQNLLPLCRVI